MTTDNEISLDQLERYLQEDLEWHERERGELELTPSQVCDLHIDFAAWLRTAEAGTCFNYFNMLFGAGNQPYDWGPEKFLPSKYQDNSHGPDLAGLRDRVDAADTFYVSHDMLAMAAEASPDLEGMPIFQHDLESTNMFIVLPSSASMGYFYREPGYVEDGEVGQRMLPIRAIHLTHATQNIRLVKEGEPVLGSEGLADGLQIMLYGDKEFISEVTGDPLNPLLGTISPKHGLVPLEFSAWVYGTPWETMAHEESLNRMAAHILGSEEILTDDTMRVVEQIGEMRRFILSLLLLMKEELYTAREKPDRPARRRMESSSLKVPDDFCVSVTRLRRPHRSKSEYDPEGESRFSHRWLVRGHWRRLNKGTADERAVWVTPYIKGPEGAPLIWKRKLTALVR